MTSQDAGSKPAKPTTPADAAKANAARRAAAKAAAATPTPPAAATPPPQQTQGASHPTKLPSRKAAAAIKSTPLPEPSNGWLVNELRTTLAEGKQDVTGVRRRLRITYAVIVVFSAGLFALGMALVGFPALAFYRGEIDEPTFGALAAAGAVALGLLLYFRPLDRLQALVADSTYVTLVKDSFQYQVALRLIALDTEDAQSVEAAAAYVGEAAQASMDLVYTQMQARRAAGFSASSG
jgi:hypothetical protein